MTGSVGPCSWRLALLIFGLDGKWRVGIVGRIDLMCELCQEIDWLGMDMNVERYRIRDLRISCRDNCH